MKMKCYLYCILICRTLVLASFIFCVFSVFASFGQGRKDTVTTAQKKTDLPAAVVKKLPEADSILSIKNLASGQDSARINEIIAIKLRTAKPIDSLSTLYVDGLPIPELRLWKSNNNQKILYYKLDTAVNRFLVEFLKGSAFDKSVIPVVFSVGSKEKIYARAGTPVYVEVRQPIGVIWVIVIAVIIGLLIIIALNKNVLKDDNNLYYSLSRTQLLFWTILVIIAYLHICFKINTLPSIPPSVLAILGISISTTALSKVVENRNKGGIDIDENAKSEGWFYDILSDGSSINIQRLQSVAFNVFFGVIFLQKALTTHLMPDFDNNVLLLLGISSGTYAALKITEPTKEQKEEPKQVGTDIEEEKTANSQAQGGTKTGNKSG